MIKYIYSVKNIKICRYIPTFNSVCHYQELELEHFELTDLTVYGTDSCQYICISMYHVFDCRSERCGEGMLH